MLNATKQQILQLVEDTLTKVEQSYNTCVGELISLTVKEQHNYAVNRHRLVCQANVKLTVLCEESLKGDGVPPDNYKS